MHNNVGKSLERLPYTQEMSARVTRSMSTSVVLKTQERLVGDLKVVKTVRKTVKKTKKVELGPQPHLIAEKLLGSHDRKGLIDKFKKLYVGDFVQGVDSVLDADPSLLDVFEEGSFPAFELKSQLTGADLEFCKEVYKNDSEKGRVLLKHYFFESLCRGLIAQQVSGAAANSILLKVKKLCNPSGEEFPVPKFFIDAATEDLRSAGCSARKSEYLKCVAEEFELNPELVDLLLNGNDEEIIEKLVGLKGIGEWSAQMFLVFGLKRLDVFATGDLAVARGAARYLKERPEVYQAMKTKVEIDPKYKCKWTGGKAKPSKRNWVPVHEQYMLHSASRFKPYRTIYMLALWKLSSTNIDSLAKAK